MAGIRKKPFGWGMALSGVFVGLGLMPSDWLSIAFLIVGGAGAFLSLMAFVASEAASVG